jgi:glycosyltransferase involved in cell wall biosynthesis
MTTAKIDVICPAWNRSAAIRPTIDSVLAQTVEDWRLIVVSDGSTDDTDDVVRGYDDPRIRLIRAEHHGHPGGPRNIGLSASTAPYIAYLDSDDQWLPHHLATLLRAFGTGARLVATASFGVNEAGDEQYRSDISNAVWHPELQLLWAMYEPSRVGHVRELTERAGGWTTENTGMEDWDLWLRFAENGEWFTPVSDRTVRMYLHPSSRRNTMAVEHRLDLGTVPTAAAAESVRAEVLAPECQALLRKAFREMTLGWYRDKAATAELSMPPDVAVDEVIAYLDRLFSDERLVLYRELRTVEENGRFTVTLPLQCSSARHARKLRSFLKVHDKVRHDIIRDVIARHR